MSKAIWAQVITRATFVILVDNACVLDYFIKIKACAVCNKNPNPTSEWSKNHELFCEINYEGSWGNMEKEGIVEMFLRSADKNNLKYAKYIGVGDSNSFIAIKQKLENKSGQEYQIEKENCISHIQKWVLLYVHIRINGKILIYQMVRLLVVLEGWQITLLIKNKYITVVQLDTIREMTKK